MLGMSTIERIQSDLQDAIDKRNSVPYFTHNAFIHVHKHVIRLRMELMCAQAIALQRLKDMK